MKRDTTHLNGFFEGVPMSSLERARAIEGMQQGMLLAELTLRRATTCAMWSSPTRRRPRRPAATPEACSGV